MCNSHCGFIVSVLVQINTRKSILGNGYTAMKADHIVSNTHTRASSLPTLLLLLGYKLAIPHRVLTIL
jgi:hypothetical protein